MDPWEPLGQFPHLVASFNILEKCSGEQGSLLSEGSTQLFCWGQTPPLCLLSRALSHCAESFFILCIFICVCTSAMTQEYSPKDNSQELVLSVLWWAFWADLRGLASTYARHLYWFLECLIFFLFNFYSCHLFREDHLVHFSAISFYGWHHPHYLQNPWGPQESAEVAE